MTGSPKMIAASFTAMVAALVLPVLGGPVVDLTNTQGQTLTAELLAVTDKAVTIRRPSDKRIFTIERKDIAPDSLKSILAKSQDLEPVYPELEVDIDVSNRRKKKDNSWYVVRQTVSVELTVSNPSRDLPCPNAEACLVLMGQNQRRPELFEVLSTSTFKVNLEPGKSMTVETKPVTTEYDSDNEGYGNMGGSKYEGYILVIRGSDKSRLLVKTTNPRFEDALEANFTLIHKVFDMKKGASFTEDLQPFVDEVIR